MTSQADADSDLSALDSRGRRLNSWKDIATCLGRDVRTVQRWHRRAGLPVYRHPDSLQRGVFAFEHELTAWANQTREAFASEPALPSTDASENSVPRSRHSTVAILIMSSLFVLTGALALWAFRLRADQAVPAEPRASMLIAIENRTGDDLLQSTVRYAVEQELSASGSVDVVPPDRVREVLRLMRRPEGSLVTPELAREIALRDGAIDAVLTGRLEGRGSSSFLSLQLVDPASGALLRTRGLQRVNRDGAFAAVAHLAPWVRTALDERHAAGKQARLPRVTTASLEALRLYSQAEGALAGNHANSARELLQSAVRADPEFASAHVKLAEAFVRDPTAGRANPAMAHHLSRAFELSSGVGEVERLRILMTYYGIRSDTVAGMAVAEALVRLRPDEWQAYSDLGFYYLFQERTREGVAAFERAAALRPDDFRLAVRAARAWAAAAGEPNRARPYVERAQKLWPAQAANFSALRMGILPAAYSRDVAWALLFPAYDRWLSGDVQGMLAEVRRVLDSEPLAKGNERDAFLTIAMSMAMTAGRLDEAADLAGRMVGTELRDLSLAVVAEVADDVATVRKHLSRIPQAEGDGRPLRFVRAGMYQRAEEILEKVGSQGGANAKAARAELALRRGRQAQAIDLFREAIAASQSNRLSEYYFAAESLATVLARLHRRDDAITVLEDAASDLPRYNTTGLSGAYWLRVLDRLAREYKRSGRNEESEAINRRMRELLALADVDHPLLVQTETR